jgi:NDP-sugar pyrophosphorylase family protein
MVKNSFGDKVEFLVETKPMGTGGVLILNQELLTEKILHINGDLYTEFDYSAFLNANYKTRPIAQLTLHKTDTPLQADLVEINQEGIVEKFIFRPHQVRTCETHWVNAGISIIAKKSLASVSSFFKTDQEVNFEKDILSKVLSQNPNGVLGYRTEDSIFDIGTPEKFFFALKESSRSSRFSACSA